MAATSGGFPKTTVAFSMVYDALHEVGIRLELDLAPNPPISGPHHGRGDIGHAAAAVSFLDPGAGRLVYSSFSINEAARLCAHQGHTDAADYGAKAALAKVNAQLGLDDWFTAQDTNG